MKNINNPPIQRKSKGSNPDVLASSLAAKANKTDLIVNILDYGAIAGDITKSTTNNTAFTNAFAAANVVRIPKGTFYVSQIVLKANQRLIGDGIDNTTLQFDNSTLTTGKAGIIFIDDSSPSSTFSNLTNITIENLSVNGGWSSISTAPTKTAHGIATWDSGSSDTLTHGRVKIKNVRIYNTPGDGIHVGSHGAEYLIDGVTVDQTYGHGMYIPRLSDSIIVNFVSTMAMLSGIYQGVGTDNGAYGGNNKFENIKVYMAAYGAKNGLYATASPAMITCGPIVSMNNIDIQQNFGDGLVLQSYMTVGNGLLLDSNGSTYKPDSANLRIQNGCSYSRLTGVISGNRFSDLSGGYIRSKYGIIIETGAIGYNIYDFMIDEMAYVRDTTAAYADGYFMLPCSYTINDPTSILKINGRSIFNPVSNAITGMTINGTPSFLGTVTQSISGSTVTLTIPSGQDSTTTRTAMLQFTVNPYSGTNNTSTGQYYNTALATSSYFLVYFRCQADYPIRLKVQLNNGHNGGTDGSSANVVIRNNNRATAWRDCLVYIPVNTVSGGATTYANAQFTVTLDQGVMVANRTYNILIDSLSYCVV